MAGTKAMLHDQVCSVTRGLEKSPSKTQGSSTLASARGNLHPGKSKGKAKSKAQHAGKSVPAKLGSAKRM
jgi:hypothetical protein